MSDIGFENIFDADSFDKGTKKIAEYIERITEEIKDAETAAKDFSTILGGQLKGEIDKLSTSSGKLATDMANITKKMDEFKTTTSTTKKVIADYKKENARLTKELEKVKKAQASAEKETKKAGTTAKSSSKSLLGMASGVAIVYQSLRFLKEQLIAATKSTIEFEQAMKEVQAISRATAQQLVLLTENANRLGATTEKTATEIAKLQKELGKLGFNTTEILASTDAIVDLSTATGEDLANSATVAAATLRAFGLEATEMNRVVDVMAGSFVRSGLDLGKFQESMKLVAPIARATNISVEATTAALSKLADAGLSGSLAGTALRNLFSEMADPTSKLVKYLGGLNEEFVDGVNSSEEMIKAFKALRDSGVDLAKAVQMVDVRARPAFFTLMNQIDAVEGLSLEYKILDREANAIAETMRDTLGNDIKIANSAFDALRRNIVEKANPAMREGTQLVTLYSEALRLLIDDITESSVVVAASEKQWLKQKSLLGRIVQTLEGINKLTGIYVSGSTYEEAIEGTNLQIENLNISLANYEKLLNGVEKAGKFIEEGNFGGAISILKEDFEGIERITKDIESNLAEGNITQEEAAALVQKRLRDELSLIGSSIKQQETTVDILKKQYDQHVKIHGNLVNDYFPTLKGVNKEQTEQQKLLDQIALIEEFLTGNSAKRLHIEALLKRVKKEYTDITAEELAAIEEANKARLTALKLEQQIAEEKLKREIEALKIAEKGEGEGQAKIDLQEALFGKEMEMLTLKYDHEVALIDANVEDVKLALLEKELAFEKYHTAVLQLGGNFANKQTKQELDAIEQTQKQLLDLEKQWKDSLEKLNAQMLKNKEKANEAEIKAEKDKWEEKQEIARLAAQGLSRLTTLIFNNRQVERDNELKAIQEWEEERLRMAGDNEEAKLRIQEEAARREAVIKKKQAQDNKKEAIFQIAVDTARGIMATIGEGGFFASPLALVVAALGAAQIATVMAQPLPQFAKGTDDSPEGFAEVGERGRELIKDGKTGKWAITPDSSTVTYLTKHSQVITNAETERILSQDHNSKADNYLSNRVKPISAPQIDYGKMGEIMDKAVSKIPSNITNFDENGVTKFVMGRSSKIKRLNKRY